MIAKPTVFVLGAGASAPYRFPSDLSRHIRDAIKPEESTPVLNDIVECGPTREEVRDFAQRLRESGRSVDEFIVAHPDYRHVGKLAIARVVAPWEDERVLDPFFQTGSPEDKQRWYHYLFDCMLRSISGQCTLADNNLTVVTFNFDRSFERALFRFVLANCVRDFDRARAVEIVGAIPIHHVHGQLGFPSWLRSLPSDTDREYWRPYGDLDFSPEALTQCAEGIRILDDEVEHDPVVHAARAAITAAEQVCFLGFSYHPLNLPKLQLDRMRSKRLLGTGYGLAEGRANAIRQTFQSLTGGNISMSTRDALSLLLEEDIVHE
jgi:hypothetical protein